MRLYRYTLEEQNRNCYEQYNTTKNVEEENAELLLRTKIFEDYLEGAVQLNLCDLQNYLKKWPGVWWNAYSMIYGQLIKPFPYTARNGFFVDINRRVATHRFHSKGIIRRDLILNDKGYLQIVPEEYKSTWFDVKDAIRTYAIIISEISPLDEDIPIEEFGLFKSWGRVSKNDRIQRPRLIKIHPKYST